MIDMTGVFPFSVLQDKYGISVDSVLRCDPSLANFIACFVLATLAVQAFMKVLEKLICAILHRSPEAVTDNLLLEIIDNLRREASFSQAAESFDDWCKKNSVPNDPTIAEFVKRVDDGDFGSRDEAIDAYMKSKTRRDTWKEFGISQQGFGQPIMLQHLLSGVFGLYAVTMANDQDSFLMFARWGVLLEVGYELVDTFKQLHPIITNEFGFGNLLMLFHHGTLYMSYPFYFYLLPSKMGWDIALAIVLYSGLVGIMVPFSFLKNFADIDLTETKGKVMYMAISSMTIPCMLIPRSVHWCYFAQKLLRFAWNEGQSWPLFAVTVVCVVIFSVFNGLSCFFVFKGLRRAIKKVRKGTEELEEDKKKDAALLRSRRRSSLINAIAQEANVNSRRISRRRSISLMGVDYELDDDEVEEIEERSKGSKVGRRSSVLSFLNTTDPIKEE